jgi:hypothetical protein
MAARHAQGVALLTIEIKRRADAREPLILKTEAEKFLIAAAWGTDRRSNPL